MADTNSQFPVGSRIWLQAEKIAWVKVLVQQAGDLGLTSGPM